MTEQFTCCSRPTGGKLREFGFAVSPLSRRFFHHLRLPTLTLMFVARSGIEAVLASGTTIICDRYAFSGVAFSTSKGLPLEWCRSPDRSLPAPDLVLFLDISPEKARERGGYGQERYEKEEMQGRVREIFGQLGTEYETSSPGKWITIDAGQSLQAVEDSIWQQVEKVVDSVDDWTR